MHSNTYMLVNKKIRLICTIALVALVLTGCSKKKFDRREWNDGDGLSWPNRAAMLDDLLANHKLKGLKYKEVINLLRYPQWNSYTDRSFEYEITRKMDRLDTVYAKSLVLYLNKDSVVTDVKVIEKDNSEKLALKRKKEKK